MSVVAVEARRRLADLEIERTDPEVQGDGEHEHDCGMAEREEEADTERALALVDQLAGGVVDGGDVVGVKGVAHPEGVGQHAGAETEDLRLGERGGDRRAPTAKSDQPTR